MILNFQMQKCLHLKEELKKKNPNLSGKWIFRPKKDGWYVYFQYEQRTKTWFAAKSSSNRTIPAFYWMFAEGLLAQLPKPEQDAVLIAEAIIPDLLFPETNGIFNRSVGNFACRDMEFWCHDLVYTNNTKTALEREGILTMFMEMNKVSYFKHLEVDNIWDYQPVLWDRTFDRYILNGEEGFVAKQQLSVFHFGKRNASLLKRKLEIEVDCLAVRLEETTGDKGNNSLTLVSKRKSGTEIRTVINRHSLQNVWRTDNSLVIGKVVTLKGMEIYEDGQIRQPTFYCIRHDKETEDYE